MDSNTHSTTAPGAGPPDDGLAGLAAAVDGLAAQDLRGLPDSVRAERVLELRRLVDRLEGHWLKELAALDACGAAGADQGEPAASTAAWLRRRLRMSAGAARGVVRAARALFGGSLPQTAAALVGGDISPAHARVVADGTQGLADQVKLEADPVLLDLAGRVDPPQLRQAVEQLCRVADPDGADRQAERRHGRRGVWLSPTWEGMVAIDGLLEPEAGTTLLAALEPLARPAGAGDGRTGGQRTADALWELARRVLEGGGLPKAGGVRPQLLVTVDLDSLLDRPGSLGGEAGWVGPLGPAACRRLACDGAVTRVVVSRQPTIDPDSRSMDHDPSVDHDPCVEGPPATRDPSEPGGLQPAAAGRGRPVAPDPGWRPSPAPGGRPGHPGRPARPTRRPGGA
jgi:hypothetical protein